MVLRDASASKNNSLNQMSSLLIVPFLSMGLSWSTLESLTSEKVPPSVKLTWELDEQQGFCCSVLLFGKKAPQILIFEFESERKCATRFFLHQQMILEPNWSLHFHPY